MSVISVIIPVYNEEENLSELYQLLDKITIGSKHIFEFIFIDDGSYDRSYRLLINLSANDPRVKVVRLSRNFGSHAACMAGLTYAKGDACAFISADLQDPPDIINSLISEWRKGFEVVIGARESQKGIERLLPKIYYNLMRRFVLQNMPADGTDVFMVDRKVVDTIISMKEKNISVFALVLWSGFSQTIITYKKMERHTGKSKWTFAKKIKLFVDTFVSFSYFPIRIISLVGTLLALLGFFYAFVVVLNRVLLSKPVEGWASLMVVVLLTSGIQMIMLGVLGEYLWRNFDETRNRPAFIISELIGIEKIKSGG